MGDVGRVLAVVGLNREAKIVAGPGVAMVVSGGVVATLAERIEAALTPDIAGILSIGIAGALDPSLRLGEAVIDGDPDWCARIASKLPEAKLGGIVGSDLMLVDAAAKSGLRRATGALAVDMESHIAADVAVSRGLLFAALRFISDDADRALPRAAQAGMRPDGGMDIVAVLRSLAADPRQLPALIRTGLEAEAAFKALAKARLKLGPGLGFDL